MNRQFTPQSSLDSLKKEAKRWLKALRANDPEARARLLHANPNAPAVPVLRDVQYALALEHGLSGWHALTRLHTTPAAAQPTLQQYQEMAEALLDAYRTGTPDALERHWRLTWHRRNWQALRTYVQLDLGKRPDSTNPDVKISLEDAQFLVAREHGFESWQALGDHLDALSVQKGAIAAKPVTLFLHDGKGDRQTVGSTREWDTVIAWMQERQIPTLHANGQMTDAVLGRLSQCDHITSLDLSGSKGLTDAGLRSLARLPCLQHLHLGGTGITDRGLDILGQLKELRSVNLGWTQVTDAGVASLAQCEHLERVDLSATHTGDGAVRALTGKRNLAHFRSGMEVTDAGLTYLGDFPVFKVWQGGDGKTALLGFDTVPNFLALRGSFTDRGTADLAGLDGLFALELNNTNLLLTGACLAPLVRLANLGWISFEGTDEAMPYIAAMPNLRQLMCQDTVAGDDGFVALSRSRSIENIWGRRCYNLQSRGFMALAEMPALRSLSVSCKNVEDAALTVLPQFPALRELMPMDVPDEGYRHIGQCQRLETLTLMYCRDTTDRATEHIVGLPHLKRYFASYNLITDRTPELLSGIASLEAVEFSGCAGLTNKGIVALAGLPHLREVHANGMPNVTSDAVAAFPAQVRVEIGT